MDITEQNTIQIFKELSRITDRIPPDFGGGSPLSKSLLMAHLFLEFGHKNYTEIGVYRGRSFLPLVWAAKQARGKAYGIDAYDNETAMEHDLDVDIAKEVNNFIAGIDFPKINQDVIDLLHELALDGNSVILKETSNKAVGFFQKNNISIDMLHIDGNHDTKQVMEDLELYLPLMSKNGLLVLDDINWDSVRPAYNQLNKTYDVIFNNGYFAIFQIGASDKKMSYLQKQKLINLHCMVENSEPKNPYRDHEVTDYSVQAKVSIVLISYNQESYISDCMESILAQKGTFQIELIIGDDCSTDRTLQIIRDYVDTFSSGRFEVKILTAPDNMGMTRNLQRCLYSCSGQYIAVCEGDDFWIDCYKLQKQVNFLKQHMECALCFHHIFIYFQEDDVFSTFEIQDALSNDTIKTDELVIEYSIGNISCCMYDARHINKIPTSLFDMFIGDWMFNLYYSQFGDIGHLKDVMSVYRKHAEGAWAGREIIDINRELIAHINEYNRFLNYQFDSEFTMVRKRLETMIQEELQDECVDIAIIDDVFPHPLSAFRMQEFICYLREFERIKIYASGISIALLGNKSLGQLLTDFKIKYPEFATKVEALFPNTIINAKLVYLVFLGNAYLYIDAIEKAQIPFVFTLYPGGWFGIDNPKSVKMLKRVTSSPYFRKVIVTQKISYEYLIKNRFCTPEQIEFIYGVVTPLEKINSEYVGKIRFGIEKDVLDICFVAHRYTEKGIDKGYDVFVDVAKELCKRHNNIRFHVVGGFDKQVIDVSSIADKIIFYNTNPIEWFDEFYKDKDIILSPNISSAIFAGSFDGFPTGSCTDAGLRKTVIFCTDELNLNTKFTDGKDIVIIPHDSTEIVDIIENYYRNPQKLNEIAENGYQKIKEIYSFEAQLLPRLNILRKELEQISDSKRMVFMETVGNKVSISGIAAFSQGLEKRFVSSLKTIVRISPSWSKTLFKKMDGKIRSNKALFSFIKLHSPEFFIRLYLKLTDQI